MKIKELQQNIEKVSQKYTSTFNIERSSDWFMLKLVEELGELNQSYLMMTKQARVKDFSDEELRKNFEDELSDVLGHVLLIAEHYDVDLTESVKRKWLKYLD